MYTLSSKLKLTAIIFMIVGAIGLIYAFIAAPSTIEEVKEMMADDASHGSSEMEIVDQDVQIADPDHAEAEHILVDDHDNEHYEHLLHQLQNKPWAALYIAAFFFFMIALGTLVFYALQYAAQAGWSPVLFRVMEGITAYLLPGSIIIFIILLLSGLHLNHLFIWMDPEIVAHDEIIQAKSGYLNVTFFLIRALIYLVGWNLFRYLLRRNSLRIDEDSTNNRWFKQNFKLSAGFLVFFMVTESMMSWDWIMSLDPHWFSTLFGWYVLSSMIVSAITVIALVSIYLKSRGYLEYVNDSHIHDLAKFMFGFSIFWTYLWFSQYMLIWYSNIPEEVTYFVTRIEDYGLPFFGMVVMNFVFPILLLMNSDYKRVNLFVIMAGIIVLLGHYLDIFVMVMPATVGESWFIGIPEISAMLLFGGLFVFVVFNALTKVPLLQKGNPFIKESKHFHY
ncbi:quinol:cytochrome C oxidoreductase [Gillisia sp. Q332]|uniref:quinol:cytochrome C oxidoreductase n=1 Tax=Gillisia xinjiangensis TaxID=3384765 RepID=UPI00391D2AEF